MPDSRNFRWVNDQRKEAESQAEKTDTGLVDARSAANDADGWQQYRQWISRAPAPKIRRNGIDPSLYSWKGYRNWTEQVKRSWAADTGDDNDS